MSDNLTQRFDEPGNGDKLNQILAIVQSLDTPLGNLEDKVELLVTMQADYRDIYDRVRGLERERTS